MTRGPIPAQIKEKEALAGDEKKARPKIQLRWLILLAPNSK